MSAVNECDGFDLESDEPSMERSLSGFSSQDPADLEGYSSKAIPTDKQDDPADFKKSIRKGLQAFSSFSYTNYSQLGELGSKKNSAR